MKYIVVTGGVISSIGKGVISSSIGTILKQSGLEVTAIKIDPYINIDAGTFSPYEHGEVFVLDDGGEVDVDLGNYERFIDIVLHKDNNITTGKIFSSVIEKERRGDFLGKTVQIVPHITDAIQDWIERVAMQCVGHITPAKTPEVCIIELGGTIGDIESMQYVEALRQFQFRVKQDNICFIHVSLVPEVSSTGEQKTKPTQSSVKDLRSQGLSPDIIVCRSQKRIDENIKNKISSFCNVSKEMVIGLHDADSIYNVPLILEKQNISQILSDKLGLGLLDNRPPQFMLKWRKLAKRSKHLIESITICVVGKYVKDNSTEAYASVIKALEHAALACRRKLTVLFVEAEYLETKTKSEKPAKYFDAWKKISESKGIIVPGGFGNRGMEGKIAVCQWARENKCPFLGVCLGMQAAVIEYARNVLNWDDACSQEMSANGGKNVIIEMPEHNPGNMGGTMRLGKRKTIFFGKPSKLHALYNNVESVNERHRHRYEVNPAFVDDLEKYNLMFVGRDESGERMEIVELSDHPYYIGIQYHPEYLSRLLKPSPPYLGLILSACDKLELYLNNTYHLSESEDDLGH